MYNYFGQCHCKKVEFKIILPHAISDFSPRKCDCDFCRFYNSSYISHPEGKIKIEDIEGLVIRKQGSKQASFLFCPVCDYLIAVTYILRDKTLGALNANLLIDKSELMNETVTSAKKLSTEEKTERWKKVFSRLI